MKTDSNKITEDAIAAMDKAIGKVREAHRKSGKPMIVWDAKNKKVLKKLLNKIMKIDSKIYPK